MTLPACPAEALPLPPRLVAAEHVPVLAVVQTEISDSALLKLTALVAAAADAAVVAVAAGAAAEDAAAPASDGNQGSCRRNFAGPQHSWAQSESWHG